MNTSRTRRSEHGKIKPLPVILIAGGLYLLSQGNLHLPTLGRSSHGDGPLPPVQGIAPNFDGGHHSRSRSHHHHDEND